MHTNPIAAAYSPPIRWISNSSTMKLAHAFKLLHDISNTKGSCDYEQPASWNDQKCHTSLDLLELLRLNDWIGLGYSIPTRSSVIKGAVMFVGVAVGPAIHVTTPAFEPG